VSHPFRPLDAFRSPRFSQIATFLRLPHHRTAADLDVAIVGIPFDGGTSYRAGARFGPREIRSQSAMIGVEPRAEGLALYEALRIADYGDIEVPPVSIERTNEIVDQEIGAIPATGGLPVSVGGDHSIALPIRRAVEEGLIDPAARSRSPAAGRSTRPTTSTSRPSTG
jgi:arginase family enzyme